MTTKTRPILFSGPMVRAILAGRKTQTRRVIIPKPTLPYVWVSADAVDGSVWWTDNPSQGEKGKTIFRKSPCVAGDSLWVRETLRRCSESGFVMYDVGRGNAERNGRPVDWPWKSNVLTARYMPRWASRLTLAVRSVRVERLADITEADAEAEGVAFWRAQFTPAELEREFVDYESLFASPVACFVRLWDSINGKRAGCAWTDNPWVWVVSFERTP